MWMRKLRKATKMMNSLKKKTQKMMTMTTVIRRKGKRSSTTVSKTPDSAGTCASRGDCPDSREDDDDDDDDDEDEPSSSTRRRIKRRRYAVLAALDDDDDDDDDDAADDAKKLEEQLETSVASVKKLPLKNRNSYKRHAITNRDDHKFRDLLDSADFLVEKHDMDKAFAIYEQVLSTNPKSPRAHFGMARAYDIQSEHKMSNKMLELAIHSYEAVVENDDTPDELFRQAADRLTERARFRGWMVKAVKAQRALLDRFPDDLNLLNEFGVTFLMMGRNDDAKKVFHDILEIDPSNGFAQAHYGFIVKVVDGDIEEGVKYLRKGVKSKAPGTQDGRFYFHLGDGLQRLGRSAEAYRVYEEGAELGLFLSKYQRSLYNVDSLISRPWWTVEQTTYGRYLKAIEKQWMIIRDEGLSVLDAKTQTFEDEEESLTEKGDWKQFTLYSKGRRHERNCAKTPRTCKVVEAFTAATKCTRGQIKFSVMQGGTRVWPHCGPTNCRLRGHLGLVVPAEPRIRVANETRAWKQGRFVIFDDSFEHEVWHDGQAFRLVLIVDMWHPDLSPDQRQQLSPI
uniref:Aspartyl/asparaginy/proline hydroxylase domain-containing protein n=1 Tax=Plectus sambesii TaxID=2011161 RepID=A0A914VUX4_9BILA